MREQLIIAALILLTLAACTQTTPEFQPREQENQSTPTGPSQQETPNDTRAPILTANTSNQPLNDTLKNLSSNDDGYQEWRRQVNNAVVLLVSDGDKAARALLEEGQETTFPLRTPVTIRVGAVDEQRAQLYIDNQSQIIKQDSQAYNHDRSVIIYLTETIVQG